MDSLTQVVLGATCGEVALGKKIGNKAVLFGAIGGTIPDLDVIIGNVFYTNEIDKIAFHRGFTHSIVFAVIASLIIGFIVYESYNSGKRKNTTTLKDWIWLFFLSIFTHPVLDCFTPYGTQLFLPFSDYRVAFNTISVVDPLYTFPLLICIVATLFFRRINPKRRKWAKAGIYISSFYMLFTIGNKLYIDTVFKKSFQEANIAFHRFSVQPTIANAILWYGIAESEDAYHVGFYSLLDTRTRADTILTISKNHHLLDVNHPDIKTMRWFSNEYYRLSDMDSLSQIIYTDLRYPFLDPKNSDSAIFTFPLVKRENERYDVIPFGGNKTDNDGLKDFWKRLKGI
ncbi:MAG: metal-dependent hydrolase [Flavobacteriaceae bacterium]|nr:MAG: metal-dependent hydrolase [Flavobacteriaceae bacterium]